MPGRAKTVRQLKVIGRFAGPRAGHALQGAGVARELRQERAVCRPRYPFRLPPLR